MRIIFLCILLLSSPCWATVIPVQSGSNTAGGVGGASSVSVTLTGVTAGDGLVAFSGNAGSGSPSSITFSGATFTSLDAGQAAAGTWAVLGYALNVTGGSKTITATVAGASAPNQVNLIVAELSAADMASFDGTAHTAANGTGTTPSSGASPATTHQNDVIVGAVQTVGAGTITAGSGYQDLITQTAGASFDIGMEFKRVSVTGTQTATFGNTLSAAYRAFVSSFKTTTADASTAHNLTLLGTGN